MKLLLGCTALTCFGSSLLLAGEPVVLNPDPKGRFHSQQHFTKKVNVLVPQKERVAGIERLEFTFRFDKSGLVSSPEMALTIGEKPFVIAPTQFYAFAEPPKDAVHYVAHASLPHRPQAVAFRIYYRGQDPKLRIGLSRTRFNPTPLGVESRWVNVRNAGPGLHAMTFYVFNSSEHPFTVTRTNFSNLPEGVTFPRVIVPPAP